MIKNHGIALSSVQCELWVCSARRFWISLRGIGLKHNDITRGFSPQLARPRGGECT